jgi:hypothetical protein
MAIGRTYNVDINAATSGTGIAVGTGGVPGGEYALLYGVTTGEYNISAVRVSTWSGASASYPSNGTITWRIRRASGTSSGFGATATVAPVSQSTTAALSTWLFMTAGATGTGSFATYGNVLWSQTMPCTAGANWGEWFTPGFELNCTTSTIAVTYQLGSAGSISAVNLIPELVISE